MQFLSKKPNHYLSWELFLWNLIIEFLDLRNNPVSLKKVFKFSSPKHLTLKEKQLTIA